MIKQQGSDPSSSHHDLALVKLTLILMLAPFASTFSYSFMATNRSNALIKDKKVNTEDNWSQAIDKTTKNNKYIWWTSEVHYIKKTLVQLLLSAGLDMSSAFSSSHLSEAANANMVPQAKRDPSKPNIASKRNLAFFKRALDLNQRQQDCWIKGNYLIRWWRHGYVKSGNTPAKTKTKINK